MSKLDEKVHLVKTNLYEQIADYLEEMILQDENVRKEEKLPSEQALAEKFGVSRNVIREALKILKERGLIDPRNGTGSYITKPRSGNISDVLSRIVVMDNVRDEDIYEIRSILESSSCKAAALRATDEQLSEMQEFLDRLEDRNISVQERREADFAFHVAIAKATGNPLIEVFVKAMRNLWIEMIEKGIFVEGGIEDAVLRHNRIMDALKKHDSELAERMMQEHLDYSRKNVETFHNSRKKES